MCRAVLLLLLTTCLIAQAAEPPPDKTVVLTFDDAVKSHVTTVAPLLRELGFGATFFVTHLWMDDAENFMSWQDIAEIHALGFEIGNHTWTHLGLNQPAAAARLEGELALVEYELARANVSKPISFAWPGNAFGPEALEVLRNAGYRFARRGMQPEIPYGEIRIGPAYDPAKHDPLLIPTAGDAYPEWSLDHFKRVVAEAKDGRVVVLQFHGVPDVVHPWVHTPPERLAEYMRYLKDEGFNVIAMRDLDRYAPDSPPDDPTTVLRHPRVDEAKLAYPPERVATLAGDLRFWLSAMAYQYQYTPAEMALVTGLPRDRQQQILSTSSRLVFGERVLPYPGGRHPRVGFLEGAINPQRGTKAGIFAPWNDGGYAVVDLPEAIFSNLGLTFLAHTHIPTFWDEQDVVIDNVDWERHPDGSLTMERTLPNDIVFGSKVIPREDGADLELWLTNGTDAPLTDLRTQVCVMLKGLTGFDAQSNDGKIFEPPYAAAPNETRDRWVIVSFDRTGRAWGNKECPCIHADPVLPDAAPGETVRVGGVMRLYEGKDIPAAIQSLPVHATSR